MREEEHSLDGNSGTVKPILNREGSITKKTKFELEQELTIVTGQIRNTVKEMLISPGGEKKIRELFSRIASVKDVGYWTPPLKEECSEINAGDTMQTNLPKEPKSTTSGTKEILPSLSVPPSKDFDEGTSHSLSIVDSSIQLLHSSMKKMLEPEVLNPERKPVVESYTVSTAVKCASEIGKLMKVKLEAMKLRREWE